MIDTDRFAKIEVLSSAELHDWLAANHQQEESVWLVTFKKSVPTKYISVGEVLDEVLCFGWIDGLRRKLDEQRTMQLLSPRRHQVWAQTYKDRAARLVEAGRMQPAGFAAIVASKQSGAWAAMAQVDALLVPPDLAAALAGRPQADEWFAGAARSYRRNVLRWIERAKAPQTRQRRIVQTVDSARKGVKIPQM
jgi:uncharacterized protein YdeI (YjbR/CyaY-like superfamily)